MDLINATSILMKTTWIEQPAVGSFRIWHVMFISFAVVLTLIVMICCCIKIRIPRTKQEIEADYQRKKIVRKFRKQLKLINNQEMDSMDLKKALDTIQKEIFQLELAASELDGQSSLSLNSDHDENILNTTEDNQQPEAVEAKTSDPASDAKPNRTFSQKVVALVKFSRLRPQAHVDDENPPP